MPWRAEATPLPLLLVLLLLWIVPPAEAQPDEARTAPAVEGSGGQHRRAPWLLGPFAATRDELRRAASRRLPSAVQSMGPPAVVLWRDERLHFDAEGKARRSRHWLYRIDSASALESWGFAEVAWNPEFEEVPKLRARVITADGEEQWLDRRVLLEQAAAGPAGSDASGRRVLRLPLPGVGVGALVEEELIIEEHRPPFVAARHGRLALPLPVPVLRGRLSFEAPERLPLKLESRLLADVEPMQRTVDGWVETVFEYGPFVAASVPEPGLLPQDPRFPGVGFSIGQDWGTLAKALASQVDAVLQKEPLEAPQVTRRTRTVHDRIGELLSALHRRVELTETSRSLWQAPRGAARQTQRQTSRQTAKQTLSQGRGDALDKAILLVAWLRAEEIPAFVALVAPGPAQDVDPELPGEQLLHRPLVYVPGADGSGDGAVWIDITDPWARAGVLGSHLTGRMTLVLSETTSQLLRLPWAQAKDHWTQTTFEVYLAEEGPSRIVETNELTGFAELSQRRLLASLNDEQRRQAYLNYVQSTYHAPHLGVVDDTAPDNLIVPYRLQLEAQQAERAFTAGDEAAVAIAVRDLVTGLAPELLTTPRGSRRGDYFFARPQRVDWRYRIHLPVGMVPRQLPVDSDEAVGSGSLRTAFRHLDGVVEADFSFHSGPIFLSARQFEVYREAVSEILQRDVLVLWFERRGEETAVD